MADFPSIGREEFERRADLFRRLAEEQADSTERAVLLRTALYWEGKAWPNGSPPERARGR